MLERREFSRVETKSARALPDLVSRWDNRARLVDVSRSGVLLESHTRVSPGTAVELLLLANEQPIVLRGEVARCHVSLIHPRFGPRYCAGVLFDRLIEPADVVVLREAPAARLNPR